MKTTLNPSLDDLKLTCVLMQAWKKASKYIRQYNWYADTLELDFQSLRLPQFLSEIQTRLEEAPLWIPSPLRVVPAPKSQKWKLDKNDTSKWKPAESIKGKLRPLAHASLADQVVTTAVMICLADHFETIQGDPNLPIEKKNNRKEVISYGNRLFCDDVGDGKLRHRWGSNKLYRQYFTDYRTFLRRPGVVVEELQKRTEETEIAVVQTDISRFYDRVRPDLLIAKIKEHSAAGATDNWFDFLEQLFNWEWRKGHDADWARKYSLEAQNPIVGFENVALPQGLVASGFFANLVLHDFDKELIGCFGKSISDTNSLVVEDVCRYVDDMRIVLTVPKNEEEADIQSEVTIWLQGVLETHANGLVIEKNKTKVTVEGREQHFRVPQSRAANRIQKDVSGTFDMLHGTELLGAIEGFFYTQKRYSQKGQPRKERVGLLVGTADIRDDTATRFAAGKFRRVFRSLRPILEDEAEIDAYNTDEEVFSGTKLALSKTQIDERAQLFAAMLIEEWVADPSNVRLLRIALDFYPDHEFLTSVLKILKDSWVVKGCQSPRKEVKQYCLAEIFRAGATETGIVGDADCLPSGVDLAAYHNRLTEEAKAILNEFWSRGSSGKRFSWYLIQQVYLYLAARNETQDIQLPLRKSNAMLSLYQHFIAFLNGAHEFSVERRCTFAALAFSAFGNKEILEQQKLTNKFIQELCFSSPSVAMEYWAIVKDRAQKSNLDTAKRMGLETDRKESLPEVARLRPNPFWDEINLLVLANSLAEHLTTNELHSPWQIECEYDQRTRQPDYQMPRIESTRIAKDSSIAQHLFVVPDWVQEDDESRQYKLGAILRFALRGSIDYFSSAREKRNPIPRYCIPISHWEQLQHGGYQGRTAFAPEWIPLSSWMDEMLFELLKWPGCGIADKRASFAEVKSALLKRRDDLQQKREKKASKLLFLEHKAPLPYRTAEEKVRRPLRIGIAQSVFPNIKVFENVRDSRGDPTLSSPEVRKKHRRHLVTLVEGIEQMLRVRETHIENDERDKRFLDLLVFPELAVHPDDIKPVLLPFVRKHRCIVLAGLVFHSRDFGQDSPLINSAMWLVPERSAQSGLSIEPIEQGKRHLTRLEESLVPKPVPYRPAQWVIEYEWDIGREPLRLSAAICYDSTDLDLATDLRDNSDVFIVCALNQDVGTFDRMAESLHYHMYQGILIVNNGEYGGSNFYLPFDKTYNRQVFHLHGQPQAQVAFIEANPRKLVCKGTHEICDTCGCSDGERDCKLEPFGTWKTPPAGWVHRIKAEDVHLP